MNTRYLLTDASRTSIPSRSAARGSLFVTQLVRRAAVVLALAALAIVSNAGQARALDRLCDPGNENCRTILISYIRSETVGIDVAFWFMEDARFSNEIISRFQAGVPVRVIMDTRANATNAYNADRLAELKSAGIPMRARTASGIMHYKMMLFAGQNIVEFSGANFSADAWSYTGDPYTNYTDESIYFTDDSSIVHSFMTKYDDLWTNTSSYANYANVTSLVRNYSTYAKAAALNFPPAESYATRALNAYSAEKTKIDVIMYRITDRRHTDAMISIKQSGIPVRLISDPQQYRDSSRLWDAWNVDRMYMAGIPIKMRAHAGLNHQKLVLLYGQGMAIFGSSNWTSPSDRSQEEHNYFSQKSTVFNWLVDQFDRKWNNSAGVIENSDFVPLPPDKPTTPSPAAYATGVSTTPTLKWYGGPWAHKYDIYLGTSSTPELIAADVELGPSQSSTQLQSYSMKTALNPGTTYYWYVAGKTMANKTKASALWSFTTTGDAAPPTVTGTAGPGDVVLYAGNALVKAGNWVQQSDATAAGGVRLWNKDNGAAKIVSASASPANYFEMSFYAEAGKPYRLWIRGKADLDKYYNDSVFVQFDGAVTSSGSATWRIGTTSGTEVNIEDCSGCGLSGWGWQDNGYGVGVFGPLVYFAKSGTQTIRIQQREDGISIDQILLSQTTYRSASPGTYKNDATILPAQDGSGATGSTITPSAGPGDIVMWASGAPVKAGNWTLVNDSSAAGGQRIRNPNASAAKIVSALASPTTYFEMTFDAIAGQPYRLWMRGKADSNYYANDSVFVQFDGSVDAGGNAVYRIGTTSAAEWNLEDCSGCGLSGWGWQDNGYGAGVLGPTIYFATSGTQTIRIQQREDGISLDQIVLSPSTFLKTAPGALKNDTTILAKQ